MARRTRRRSRSLAGLSGSAKAHLMEADEAVKTAIRKYNSAYSEAQVGECREAFLKYSEGREAEGAADAHEKYSKKLQKFRNDALDRQLDDSESSARGSIVRNCFVKRK